MFVNIVNHFNWGSVICWGFDQYLHDIGIIIIVLIFMIIIKVSIRRRMPGLLRPANSSAINKNRLSSSRSLMVSACWSFAILPKVSHHNSPHHIVSLQKLWYHVVANILLFLFSKYCSTMWAAAVSCGQHPITQILLLFDLRVVILQLLLAHCHHHHHRLNHHHHHHHQQCWFNIN